MNISPIQNLNFTARYRMLVSKDEYKDFKENTVPILDKVYGNNYAYAYGKSPIYGYYKDTLDAYIEQSNDKAKTIQQLKELGVRIANPKYETLWISTGKKDSFELKTVEMFSKANFLSGIDGANIMYLQNCNDEVLGNYLIQSMESRADMESKYFSNFVKYHPFTKISGIKELLRKI